jgi:hypothetical protein
MSGKPGFKSDRLQVKLPRLHDQAVRVSMAAGGRCVLVRNDSFSIVATAGNIPRHEGIAHTALRVHAARWNARALLDRQAIEHER